VPEIVKVQPRNTDRRNSLACSLNQESKASPT
jgi:hypothetical protein